LKIRNRQERPSCSSGPRTMSQFLAANYRCDPQQDVECRIPRALNERNDL
jgi:hypothetical protein